MSIKCEKPTAGKFRKLKAHLSSRKLKENFLQDNPGDPV
jgi:hypothetical protein